MVRTPPHVAVALALTLTLAAAAVVAQPAPPSLDAAIAEALALRVDGRDAEALVILTRAWEATRSPRARAQMARAEQALGRWLDAEQHMTEALAADDPWVAARRASLEAERARVRDHLGRVEVLGLPAGARVRVDGRGPYVTPLAEPPWSAAGTALVTVEAEGFFPLTRRVLVDAGATTRESLTLVPVPPPTPSPAPPAPSLPLPPLTRAAPPSDPALRRAFGVAGVATGAVFLLGAVAAHVTRELVVSGAASQGCGYDPSGRLVGPADCADRVASADVATALAVTGYVLGAVTAGAGVALVATTARARIAWACAPAGVGLACAVQF